MLYIDEYSGCSCPFDLYGEPIGDAVKVLFARVALRLAIVVLNDERKARVGWSAVGPRHGGCREREGRHESTAKVELVGVPHRRGRVGLTGA